MLDGDVSSDTWFQKGLRACQGETRGYKDIRHVADLELNSKSFPRQMAECHVVFSN